MPELPPKPSATTPAHPAGGPPTGAKRNLSSFNLPRLREQVRPFEVHWFTRLRSTSDHAAEMRKRGELFAPAIVLCGTQTAGRGRGGNVWWSGRGSLTTTFVFPIDDQVEPHQVPLIAGLAVRSAIADLTGDTGVQLKWPNDILYGGRKIAGLLCERMDKVDLIGVGVNVNIPASLAPTALARQITSLSEITGNLHDITRVLIAITRRLDDLLSRRANHPFPTLLVEYDRHHALIGREVVVTGSPTELPVSGICRGLDSSGRLLVKVGPKTVPVIAGSVSVR